ncbi:Der GTPase-activating protein YihI [Aliidiomarina halalkaliphila]|nr:Der GTPase-activating protein YihI [Aliidiomarina halalkaliphila]
MTRQKKTRKSGPLALRKAERPEAKQQKGKAGKDKGKGLPSGARYAVGKPSSAGTAGAASKADPRHGSKKPIALKVKPKAMSPEKEFEWIENDQKLQGLLAQLENGIVLNKNDQAYVDTQLARYQELADRLGIEIDDSDDDEDWEYDTSDMLDEALEEDPDFDRGAEFDSGFDSDTDSNERK